MTISIQYLQNDCIFKFYYASHVPVVVSYSGCGAGCKSCSWSTDHMKCTACVSSGYTTDVYPATSTLADPSICHCKGNTTQLLYLKYLISGWFDRVLLYHSLQTWILKLSLILQAKFTVSPMVCTYLLLISRTFIQSTQ